MTTQYNKGKMKIGNEYMLVGHFNWSTNGVSWIESIVMKQICCQEAHFEFGSHTVNRLLNLVSTLGYKKYISQALPI